jgi:hypothetical protein
MTRFYTLGEKSDGVFKYTQANLASLFEMLFDGKYLITIQGLNPKSSIKDYRACYFAKLDALAADVGETRYDLHEIVKGEILVEMLKNTPELFHTETLSTQQLNEYGWMVFIEQLELWAFTTYGVILR